ncbi:hypothetical protein RYX36_011124 [Vicia faba]
MYPLCSSVPVVPKIVMVLNDEMVLHCRCHEVASHSTSDRFFLCCCKHISMLLEFRGCLTLGVQDYLCKNSWKVKDPNKMHNAEPLMSAEKFTRLLVLTDLLF